MNITDRLYIDKDNIVNRYNNGEGTSKIAKDYGCNSSTVYLFLRDRLKIKMIRSRSTNYGCMQQCYDQIRQYYNEGKSCKEIAKILDISSFTIEKTCQKLGLDTSRYSSQRTDKVVNHIDEIKKLYDDGLTFQQIADKFNTTESVISTLFKRKGLKARPIGQHDFDKTFFEAIDTPEKAYVLGWMYSDGNVNLKGESRIQITDLEILEKIRELLKCTAPIYTVPAPKKYPHRKIQYVLRFCSRKVVADLIKLGCVPNKSLILKFPTLEQVPDALIPHFVRGYMDGDGSIQHQTKNTYVVSLTSTLDFINGLLAHISLSNIHIYTRHPKRQNSTRTLIISNIEDNISFLNWIYKNSTIHLDRKYMLASPLLSK